MQDIIKIREKLQLSQVQFANELGVSQATLSRWELGRVRPSPMARKNIEKLMAQKGIAYEPVSNSANG